MLAAWLRTNLPVAAVRIVIAGAAGRASIGVTVRAPPADCPNAVRLTSIINIHTGNRTVCLKFIGNAKKLAGRMFRPSQYSFRAVVGRN